MELIKREIAAGYNPFSGPIYAQDGTQKNKEGQSLSPEAIITMDWLLDNVEGEIPCIGTLKEEARPMVLLQGIPAFNGSAADSTGTA